MKLMLNLLVIIIFAYTGYIGYKRGIISSLLGFLSLILSVYIAFLISNTYSNEFLGLVSPFAGGLVDSAITDTVERDYTGGITDNSADDTKNGEEDGLSVLLEPVMSLSETDKKDPYTVCLASLRRLGVSENAASKIAMRVSEKSKNVGQKFIDAATEEFSLVICRVAIFAIAFILAAIAFTVIGNILSINFGLPGLESVNNIGGAIIGIGKGIIVLMFIGCLMRYVGIFIPEEKITGAFLFGMFVSRNIIASRVGI